MKLSLVIPLDNKIQKVVDQYRYQYDRKLLKSYEPVIELTPPIEIYTNLKTLNSQLRKAIFSKKKFKVSIREIGSEFPEYPYLFFNVKIDSKLSSLINEAMALFHHPDYENGIEPKVYFYHQNNFDEAEKIYQELGDESLKQDFMVSSISLIMQNEDSDTWELVETYNM